MKFCRNDFETTATSPFKEDKKIYKRQEPYFCKSCDRVWHLSSLNFTTCSPEKAIPEYIFGFPRYGCFKLRCLNCRKGKK